MKGSGPTALLVVVRSPHAYLTEAEARADAEFFVRLRVTTWDDRQGVLFLEVPAQPYTPAAASDGAAGATGRASATVLRFTQSNYDQSVWDYSVDTLSRAWLPAREAGAAARDSDGAAGQAGGTASTVFITDGAASPPPVVTLTDLRAKIAAMAAELQAGAGVEGYVGCLRSKIALERERRADPWDSASENSSAGLRVCCRDRGESSNEVVSRAAVPPLVAQRPGPRALPGLD